MQVSLEEKEIEVTLDEDRQREVQTGLSHDHDPKTFSVASKEEISGVLLKEGREEERHVLLSFVR